jgi:hypothetical protein
MIDIKYIRYILALRKNYLEQVFKKGAVLETTRDKATG